MLDTHPRLFIGIKISRKLQEELDRAHPGSDRYLNKGSPDDLDVITKGEAKVIGRYLDNRFPTSNIESVSRKVCSIIKLITHGQRIEDSSIHLYVA
jgi:hypothetical protein